MVVKTKQQNVSFPYKPYFFHTFKAIVKSNAVQQFFGQSHPIIRGDAEFETKLLFKAVKYNACIGLKHFLECDMDPNLLSTKSGDTVLHHAVMKGKKGIVCLLLQNKNVDPNKRNYQGDNPLCSSLSKQSTEITAMLLKHSNINPNMAGKYGSAPLHYAIHNPHKGTLYTKMLLNHKDTDPNGINDVGQTPLFMSLFLAKNDTIKLLLQDDRLDLDRKSLYMGVEYTPLTTMICLLRHYNDYNMIPFLLKNGADPNVVTKNYTFGSTDIEAPRANLAINETTALFQAIMCSKPPIIKALILAGADIKVKKEFLLAGNSKKTFSPYEFSLFIQENPVYADKKDEQTEISQILAQAGILLEEARIRKLGSGSLFKGLVKKQMGITR